MRKRLLVFALLVALAALTGCQAAAPQVQTVIVTATPAPATPTVVPTEAPTQTPVIVVVTATPAPVTPTPDPGSSITISSDEQEQTLSIADLADLNVAEGYAGTKSSTGKITAPAMFRGVSVLDLCNMVADCDESMAVNVVAKDGYSMTFSYDQYADGSFVTFDPATGDEKTYDGDLTLVVGYEREGEPIPAEEEGPLRLAIIGEDPTQVTDGHWSIKWVREITVKPAVAEWTLHLEGALVEEMDRNTFESGASPNCHETAWVDGDGHEWTGIPLYYLVGRVDDGNKHEGGAFNDEVAAAGYEVDVIAADGYTVTLDAAAVNRNKNIVLANLMDGEPIADDNWPLRLVGSDLAKAETVGAVAQIVLRGDSIVPVEAEAEAEITAEPTAAPEVEEVEAEAPEMEAGVLHVYGKVGTPIAFDRAALEQLGVETIDIEHPKKGTITVEGVRLADVLAACAPASDASTITFSASDGYSAQGDLAEIAACADCVVQLDDDGFSLAMSGMDSGLWVKDVQLVEIN